MSSMEATGKDNLWRELEAARLTPETVNLTHLWQLAEEAIAAVPEELRLNVAGEIVLQIAEVFVARADSLLSCWEQAQQTAEASVTEEDFSELLLRQSMQIDFSDLILVPDHKYNRAGEGANNGDELADSIVGNLDKAALLEAFSSEIELVETQVHKDSGAIKVTEEEDIEGWAAAIAKWMMQRENSKVVSLIGVKVAKLQPSATQRLKLSYDRSLRKVFYFSIQPKILKTSWC